MALWWKSLFVNPLALAKENLVIYGDRHLSIISAADGRVLYRRAFNKMTVRTGANVLPLVANQSLYLATADGVGRYTFK